MTPERRQQLYDLLDDEDAGIVDFVTAIEDLLEENRELRKGLELIKASRNGWNDDSVCDCDQCLEKNEMAEEALL